MLIYQQKYKGVIMQEIDNLFIEILRKKSSYEFLLNKNYKYIGNDKNTFTFADYHNNIKNNMLDTIRIFQWTKENKEDISVIFENNQYQTVANYPLADYKDTIGVGKFQILCFVNQGNYYQGIHGIINCYDIEGQKIENSSMQLEDGYMKGRWLLHDTAYKKNGKWLFPSYAYSKGCFIQYPSQQKYMNELLRKYGVNRDNYYIINGELKEV